jgi:hypothetical protein
MAMKKWYVLTTPQVMLLALILEIYYLDVVPPIL